MNLKHLLYYIVPLIVCFIKAQELPPIEIYNPEVYGGESQNWSISQSSNKNIYIANNKGLLEFNGSTWGLYPTVNETIMRSVKVVDDKIYTGSYMDFGYWVYDQYNKLTYTSLTEKLKIELVDDEQFWSILSLDNWILFQSLNRIYIYNTDNDQYKIIDSKTNISKMYELDGNIYYQEMGVGVFKIKKGVGELLIENDLVKEEKIVNLYSFGQAIIVQFIDGGFYLFENELFKKWAVPANEVVSKMSVYSSIRLNDGSFLLGTISNGLVKVNATGTLGYQINKTNGLSNNTVLNVFEDKEKNIWLGLDNGIDCINESSYFRFYNDITGDVGSVYASALYKGHLYLGTNQGLFYKKIDSDEKFKFITNTGGQVWFLKVIDDQLLCGHDKGTFMVDQNKAEKIVDIEGTWNIKKVPNHSNLLVQGNYDGLNILEKSNNSWKFRNKIEGFDISSRFFEILGETIFVSHEYKGVYEVEVDHDFKKALSINQELEGIDGFNSGLVKYQNQILFAFKDGVFRFDEIKGKFSKDSVFDNLFTEDNYTSGKLIVDEKTGRLWSFNKDEIKYTLPGKISDKPEVNSIPLISNLRNTKNGYENIIPLGNEKYLLGNELGYFVLDLNQYNESIKKQRNFKVYIHSVKSSSFDKNIVNFLESNQIGEIKHNENNVQITFNVPEFDKYIIPEYIFKLEGFYDGWSAWETKSSENFKNLPYGDYVFKVKARMGNQVSSNEAVYKFTVLRPWYWSNMAIVFYGLLFIGFLLLVHSLYKRYYMSYRKELLEKAQNEIELKELENKEQAMRFANEKLQQDIASKNKELATSTMNIIKKNEFLNRIKSQINSRKSDEDLQDVIKIIDENLNNSDDWKLFESAFNNADKHFLSTIKASHPNLTPNDLRLCAYLRLNLSSKEIAPLLNISTRSVEVKRYRLRKKMNLSHEVSLTNYILEL
ncbi:hypothetical protein UJ101_00415 [Flavobacteriaceae bacterium UJ101]|nr:hypothetical protein UJ101_00415 [Flavobacteriaceae bacterium UJ101]